MKRIIAHWNKVVVLALAALVCTAGAVWAVSAHFINSKTSVTIASNGNLTVQWKEAGLGDNQRIDYTFAATANVACVCVTNSGQCPNASNKAKGSIATHTSGSFDVKNGAVIGSLTIPAPGCPASLQPTCGGGQHFELVDLTWTTLSLSDDTTPLPAGGLPSSLGLTGLFVCP